MRERNRERQRDRQTDRQTETETERGAKGDKVQNWWMCHILVK